MGSQGNLQRMIKELNEVLKGGLVMNMKKTEVTFNNQLAGEKKRSAVKYRTVEDYTNVGQSVNPFHDREIKRTIGIGWKAFGRGVGGGKGSGGKGKKA